MPQSQYWDKVTIQSMIANRKVMHTDYCDNKFTMNIIISEELFDEEEFTKVMKNCEIIFNKKEDQFESILFGFEYNDEFEYLNDKIKNINSQYITQQETKSHIKYASDYNYRYGYYKYTLFVDQFLSFEIYGNVDDDKYSIYACFDYLLNYLTYTII